MGRRSEQEIQEILDRLAALIQSQPGELSRSEIQDRYRDEYNEELPSRSLRRWLSQLDEAERIKAEGVGGGRVYLSPSAASTVEEERGASSTPEDTDETIPLSAEAAELRRLIQQPRTEREPVTYNRQFLGEYEPGETWYLSAELREELRDAGQTPDPERPAGTYARNILEPLLIDLSWSSSRLEGNTYSRVDTEDLIKEGKEAEGKDPKEAQMILNHKAAIEQLVDNAERTGFNRFTLLTLHANLAENLMGDPGREGALRTGQVQISDCTYTPVAIPQVIEECFDTILDKATAIPDPFEQAFFIMVHIPYLQPFWDANKRTSRIAANIPLFRQNLVPLSFVDVPRQQYLEAIISVYELNRVELLRDIFEWAYRRVMTQKY